MQGWEAIQWKNRAASRLSNGVIQLIALTGGGHLAELRFESPEGHSTENVLWDAPWETGDPGLPHTSELARHYGPPGTGIFLASYSGHALCLDSFGGPSDRELAEGRTLHGEAAVKMWTVIPPEQAKEPVCGWKVSLPIAQLSFERKIRLGAGESVAFIEETVSNHRNAEYAFDWVQHATFGPPFLERGECTLAVSTQRGVTWPLDYEGGGPLLKRDVEFSWPNAPRADGKGVVNISQPFNEMGRGFLASLQMDTRRRMEYLFVANWKLRLGVGYCFRREDFPWMAVWEENHARPDAPWNGKVQARGMEFGTTAMPLGREENLRRGRIFDTPNGCVLAAGAKKTARYLVFLTPLPSELRAVSDIRASGDTILVLGEGGEAALTIPAGGCEAFLGPHQTPAALG